MTGFEKCPFCGGRSCRIYAMDDDGYELDSEAYVDCGEDISYDEWLDQTADYWAVWCDCGAQMFRNSKNDAIKAWNARVLI